MESTAHGVVPKVCYLGHIFDGSGMYPDPYKCDTTYVTGFAKTVPIGTTIEIRFMA